ncbi:MAG: DUF3887 domain-containing protein [bacterium]|nr:DUF3887 domain-containing protein [bacterium]
MNEQRGGVFRRLFNPFYTMAGGAALGTGLAVILATAFLAAMSHSHVDGVLDFHSGLDAPLWVYPFEGIVNWLSMALCVWAAGAIASKSRIRAIDVFGTQALARWPMLIAVVAALLPGYTRFSEALLTIVTDSRFARNPAAFGELLAEAGVRGIDIAMFGVTAVAVLVAIVWMVALMYRAYAVACNVRGARGAASFIPALLVGWVVSKIVILAVFYGTGALGATLPEPGTPLFDVGQKGSEYASLLTSGQFDEAVAQFDDVMARDIPADRLKTLWDGVAAPLGAFVGHGAPRVEQRGAMTSVYVPCIYETGRFDVQIVFDDGGKVAGLWNKNFRDGENNRPADAGSGGEAQ